MVLLHHFTTILPELRPHQALTLEQSNRVQLGLHPTAVDVMRSGDVCVCVCSHVKMTFAWPVQIAGSAP